MWPSWCKTRYRVCLGTRKPGKSWIFEISFSRPVNPPFRELSILLKYKGTFYKVQLIPCACMNVEGGGDNFSISILAEV